MITKKYLEPLFLFLFIITKFILQYSIVHPIYNLHRDEYLHLDQAKHLAWGYLSVPPFTSWNSFIILLLGNSEFWIKFFPALYGALTIVIVWLLIKELKGNIFALVLGATCVLLSALLRINILYQPTSLEVLLWTGFYFFFLKFIHSHHQKWLYIMSITLAIGFLNKYNIAFLLIGFFPAILLSMHRNIFLNRHLYYAAVLGLLIILPNLIWQYQNNFPVFHHLNQLNNSQLFHVKRIDFIKEQVLFFLGGLIVLLPSFYALLAYPPFKKYKVYLWAYIFTIAVFILLKAKAYYALGLYPVLIAFGAIYLEQILQSRWQLIFKPLLILIPILLSIPMFKYAFPNKTPNQIHSDIDNYQKLGLLRWEDGKDHSLPQDFADMLGWDELAAKVDRAYATLPQNDHTIILCDNYGQAGAINYYSANKNLNAVSMNADYINWFNLGKPIQHVILVQDKTDSDKQREKEKPLFEDVYAFDSITNVNARERGTMIYILKNAKADINSILRNDIANEKLY